MPLMALRFLHGLFAGQLVGVGFALIARTASPEGTFGVLLFFEYGFAGVLLWVLPPLIREVGSILVFAALAGFSVLTLVTIPFIPEHPPRAAATPAAAAKLPARASLVPLVVAFASIFLFSGLEHGRRRFRHSTGAALRTCDRARQRGPWRIWVGEHVRMPARGLGGHAIRPPAANRRRHDRAAAFDLGLPFQCFADSLFHRLLRIGGSVGVHDPVPAGHVRGLRSTGRMATLSGFFSKMGLASGPLAWDCCSGGRITI